jgi:hypothetical protein
VQVARSAFLILLVGLTVAVPAARAAEPNDNFASRLPIQLGFADSRGNTDATIESQERFTANDPSGSQCSRQGQETTTGGVQMNGTLWWEFTGTGEPITVSTLNANFDTVIAVYDQDAGMTMVGCNDDIQPGDATRPNLEFRPQSEVLVKNTVAGHRYAVQVGGCSGSCWTVTAGTITVRVSPPPPNDSRANPTPVPTGAQVSGTNTGSTTEQGELTVCARNDKTSLFGKTVWYRWTAPAPGTAVFSVSGVVSGTSKPLDTVMAVYRGASPTPLGCNDDAVAGELAGSRLPMSQPAGPPVVVEPGEYLVQVGGYFDEGFAPIAARNGPHNVQVEFTPDPDVDDDGVERNADCNDSDPRIHPGAKEIPNNGVDEDCDGHVAVDADEDGYLAPPQDENNLVDCRDDDPMIHPGAAETGDNRVDENCDGADAPLPQLRPGISYLFDPAGRNTVFTKLTAGPIQAKTKVTIRCHGRCSKRAASVKYKKEVAKVNLLGLLRRALGVRAKERPLVRPGDRIEIAFQKSQWRSLVRIYTIRKGKGPSSRTYCVTPLGRGKCPG